LNATAVGINSNAADSNATAIGPNSKASANATGVALVMAAGGVPAVPPGRKLGMFGNIATYDGHGAAGVGLTGVLLETRSYQIQANGSVGMGFDTSVVGARGGVAMFW
jgi:hypothetical protein